MCAHTHSYICMHTQACACKCTYTHVHAFMHTHTHTHRVENRSLLLPLQNSTETSVMLQDRLHIQRHTCLFLSYTMWVALFQIKNVMSNGTQVVVGRYCSNVAPPVIVSSSNRLLVKFHSDSSSSATGFSTNWTTSMAMNCFPFDIFCGMHVCVFVCVVWTWCVLAKACFVCVLI